MESDSLPVEIDRLRRDITRLEIEKKSVKPARQEIIAKELKNFGPKTMNFPAVGTRKKINLENFHNLQRRIDELEHLAD